MNIFKSLLRDSLHLFYPHVCNGCGSDLLGKGSLLCLACIRRLPNTNFAAFPGNPVEKIFWGRMHLQAAHSQFFFTKGNLVQHLIHQLKYKQNKAIGIYLGELTGNCLLLSERFKHIDALVPLPLYADREHRRGYNQAAIICKGISNAMNLPILNNVSRQYPTQTQTRKHRTERWDNVKESFNIKDVKEIAGKHLLLVDDVITTGATLEACGKILLSIENVRVSIATLAHADK